MSSLNAQYSGFPAAHEHAVPEARGGVLRFRLKAFGFHLSASATLLTLVLGSLYLGWYRWPGWYLAGVSGVVIIMMTVDVALGPLLTLVIASSTKPRRELARDIAMIAAVQLTALVYGATTLWQGRPLYYVYAVNRLEMVQAGGIDSSERVQMRTQEPELAPHWYSLPRWVSAPFDPKPQDFKAWDRGIPELRRHLSKVGDERMFNRTQRESLERTMERLGLAVNQPNTIPFHGSAGRLLLAVFDRKSMRLEASLAPGS
jgi:hypothetical protein